MSSELSSAHGWVTFTVARQCSVEPRRYGGGGGVPFASCEGSLLGFKGDLQVTLRDRLGTSLVPELSS